MVKFASLIDGDSLVIKFLNVSKEQRSSILSNLEDLIKLIDTGEDEDTPVLDLEPPAENDEVMAIGSMNTIPEGNFRGNTVESMYMEQGGMYGLSYVLSNALKFGSTPEEKKQAKDLYVEAVQYTVGIFRGLLEDKTDSFRSFASAFRKFLKNEVPEGTDLDQLIEMSDEESNEEQIAPIYDKMLISLINRMEKSISD